MGMDGRRCRVHRDRGSKTRVGESAQPPHQCFVGCVFWSDVERFAPALLFLFLEVALHLGYECCAVPWLAPTGRNK